MRPTGDYELVDLDFSPRHNDARLRAPITGTEPHGSRYAPSSGSRASPAPARCAQRKNTNCSAGPAFKTQTNEITSPPSRASPRTDGRSATNEVPAGALGADPANARYRLPKPVSPRCKIVSHAFQRRSSTARAANSPRTTPESIMYRPRRNPDEPQVSEAAEANPWSDVTLARPLCSCTCRADQTVGTRPAGHNPRPP